MTADNNGTDRYNETTPHVTGASCQPALPLLGLAKCALS